MPKRLIYVWDRGIVTVTKSACPNHNIRSISRANILSLNALYRVTLPFFLHIRLSTTQKSLWKGERGKTLPWKKDEAPNKQRMRLQKWPYRFLFRALRLWKAPKETKRVETLAVYWSHRAWKSPIFPRRVRTVGIARVRILYINQSFKPAHLHKAWLVIKSL